MTCGFDIRRRRKEKFLSVRFVRAMRQYFWIIFFPSLNSSSRRPRVNICVCMYICMCPDSPFAQVQESNNRTVKGNMRVSIERNKKRKPLITLLSLDFFFFLRASTSLPTEHLCINTEFGSFSSQEITTTWKSGARTDTCDCCCCLLLFTLFSILLARTRPAAGSGRGVPD